MVIVSFRECRKCGRKNAPFGDRRSPSGACDYCEGEVSLEGCFGLVRIDPWGAVKKAARFAIRVDQLERCRANRIPITPQPGDLCVAHWVHNLCAAEKVAQKKLDDELERAEQFLRGSGASFVPAPMVLELGARRHQLRR